MIKVGSDFSGVGAFNQALMRLGVKYKEVFACDMDKYARQTFIHNYGEPGYYPTDVYEREIPSESLDIYMTSPPCQAFSLAGKRLGKDDKRGILFFNSYEFIQQNKPRYFIFENVKGLLSDDGGRTFNEWTNMLGGKSVNGNPVLFPYDESVPYHIYWKVLNAKHHGVPQNRERVFIIGIRDDSDNTFRWPIDEHLTKRLKDVLEDDCDKKYFLSENNIEKLIQYDIRQKEKGNGFGAKFHDEDGTMSALKVGDSGCDDLVKIKSATLKGYEEATEGDSINFSVPNSETRRGRVGKQVAQTLDTACNQGVMIGAFRGRNPNNSSDRTTGSPTEQRLEINSQGTSNTITSVQKDNIVVLIGDYRKDEGFRWRQDGNSPTLCARAREDGSGQPIIQYNDKRLNATIQKNELPTGEIKAIDTYNQKVQDNAPTLTEPHHNTTRLWDGYKIRRLTPRECFRLMDFPDTFTWPVSDSQAYKQAGNSIVVNVLYKIIKNLNL
jgi:DNA (cytosine-5)-methyltransferase 1